MKSRTAASKLSYICDFEELGVAERIRHEVIEE